MEFDEYNAKSTTYSFVRNHTIPSNSSEFKIGSKTVKADKTSNLDPTQAKKDNSTDSDLNSMDLKILEKRREKGKAIMIINEKDHSNHSKNSKCSSKRKVSFFSPQTTLSHNSGIANKRQLRFKSPSVVHKGDSSDTKDIQNKSSLKKYYRIKRQPTTILSKLLEVNLGPYLLLKSI